MHWYFRIKTESVKVASYRATETRRDRINYAHAFDRCMRID